MVNHYHGTPIWGLKSEVLKVAVTGAGAFVSFIRPDQIKQCFESADSVAIDNGAFSAWRRGIDIDWTSFYCWLGQFYHHKKLAFFVIPDVITGTELENDNMILSVPSMFKDKAVPVWHLHESLSRLDRLCCNWPIVALGSSGEYAQIRSPQWHERMNRAFDIIGNWPTVKIHGLRMLDGRVLGNYPLDSADSTNLACNVPKFKVKYPKLGADLIKRCAILKGAIESVIPPDRVEWLHDYRQKRFAYSFGLGGLNQTNQPR